MNDFILNMSMLLLCCKCYIDKDDEPSKDFMISPLFTPPQILEQYPNAYMLICEKDPLHDDAVRFVHKMA